MHRYESHLTPHPGFMSALWRLADPTIAVASAVPFVGAVAIAHTQTGSVDVALAAAAFLAIFFVEVGKNAVNDLADYRSGADLEVHADERSPFSGGKRVLVDHLVTEQELTAIAWAAFIAAGVVGAIVALQSTPALLLLGGAAAAIGVAYSAPPFRLAYRGLGEVAVLLVYGPGIVIGGVLLQQGSVTLEVLIVSMTLGFLIANVLLANEIPDERADRWAGKRTLVVRLGADRAASLIDAVFIGAFALPLLAAFYTPVPFRVVALAAGMPVAIVASDLFARPRHPGPPVLAQALTIATYVVSGVSYAVFA